MVLLDFLVDNMIPIGICCTPPLFRLLGLQKREGVRFLHKKLGLHCLVDTACMVSLEWVLQKSKKASKSLVGGVFVLRISRDGHSSVVRQQAVFLTLCMSFLVLVRAMRVLWLFRARKCKRWGTITQLTLMGIFLWSWKDLPNHRWPTPGLYLLFLYCVIACWDLKAAEAGVFAPSKTEASPVLQEASPVLADVPTRSEAQASPVLQDMSGLEKLDRRKLQALAKLHNVPGNLKSTVIRAKLLNLGDAIRYP